MPPLWRKMGRLNFRMKNSQNITSAASAETPGVNSVLRFWACFAVCLIVLGAISGLMLAGFFLLMGYHVF
jgi:hypothetical protein